MPRGDLGDADHRVRAGTSGSKLNRQILRGEGRQEALLLLQLHEVHAVLFQSAFTKEGFRNMGQQVDQWVANTVNVKSLHRLVGGWRLETGRGRDPFLQPMVWVAEC